TGDPDLGRLLASSQPPPHTVEPEAAVERAERHLQRQLVQVPAQPLLAAATLGDQVVAVIDEQLQLAQRLLARTGLVEPRFLERRPRRRERVDRVGLAAPSPPPTRGRRQPGRYPQQLLSGGKQRLLEAARDVPAVFERPQPLRLERARPLEQRF